MGIITIYTCDNPKCRLKKEFGCSSSLEDLEKNRWLVEPLCGGCAVYCPTCREEKDNLRLEEDFIRNRHEHQIQKEIQELYRKGVKPMKKMVIKRVSAKDIKEILAKKKNKK